MVRRNAADAVRRALSSGPQAGPVRDVVQDWWRDQAPATGVTVRDDMRQEVFRPLPIHLGALDETLKWGGEAAEAAEPPLGLEGSGCPWAHTEGPADAGTAKNLVCGADGTR
ncbi:hypothetical protein ABZ642_16080 [Streptomyces sp. NPDC007157]|uniref:hypothetical protein n=1 Tax=Streptomyces sp. NPDC007157 TaxID=3154681 RepID=UPI0033ECFA64